MNTLDAPRFGSGVGLHRVDALLDALRIDRDWLSKTAVSITGSNGKGSTALCCSRIAAAHGLKTGLFTSPHLYRPTERFRIGGEEVSEEDLQSSLDRVRAAADQYSAEHPHDEIAGFELLFAAAADLFSRKQCQLCVYEAGIGGRYDPVRLAQAGAAAVTSLDYEHTALLGSSLDLICLDKSDIVARSGSVFYGAGCRPLSSLIRTYARLQETQPRILGEDVPFAVESLGRDGATFDVGLRAGACRFSVPLIGEHQANNAALALLVFEAWCQRTGSVPFSPRAAASGLAEARWPGRLEVLETSPLTVIDVGHTPDGIRAALRGLRTAFGEQRFVLVCGVSEDKDAEAIIRILAPDFLHIICTRAWHKGRDAEQIAAFAGEANPAATVMVEQTIEGALVRARAVAAEDRLGIYSAGGMYLAAELACAVRGEDPRTLPHLF